MSGSRSDLPPLDDALSGIGLFDRLDQSIRHRVIAVARPRHYARGESVYAEAGGSEELLLWMSGAAALFRGGFGTYRTVLAVVRPPGVLGEEALGGIPRMASAEALQDSFALALPAAELAALMRRYPAMGEAARGWLALQLARLFEQRTDDVLLDLPGRVAKTLVDLALHADPPTVVDLGQGTLASLARGSRQRVNQVLRQFADRGWVQLERRQIAITELDALSRAAGQPVAAVGE